MPNQIINYLTYFCTKTMQHLLTLSTGTGSLLFKVGSDFVLDGIFEVFLDDDCCLATFNSSFNRLTSSVSLLIVDWSIV